MDITNGPFSDIVTGIIEVASADLLQTTAAAAAMGIVPALIIPMECLMIVLRLLKLKKLGIFAQIIAIMVSHWQHMQVVWTSGVINPYQGFVCPMVNGVNSKIRNNNIIMILNYQTQKLKGTCWQKLAIV